jgi:hypothetical protein
VGRNTNINVRTLHGTDSSTESMAGRNRCINKEHGRHGLDLLYPHDDDGDLFHQF